MKHITIAILIGVWTGLCFALGLSAPVIVFTTILNFVALIFLTNSEINFKNITQQFSQTKKEIKENLDMENVEVKSEPEPETPATNEDRYIASVERAKEDLESIVKMVRNIGVEDKAKEYLDLIEKKMVHLVSAIRENPHDERKVRKTIRSISDVRGMATSAQNLKQLGHLKPETMDILMESIKDTTLLIEKEGQTLTTEHDRSIVVSGKHIKTRLKGEGVING